MRFKLNTADFGSCPQFNQWLDEGYEKDHGQLEIFSYRPRPSEVLFQMKPHTYSAAFADFQREYDDDLKRVIADSFPSPIAHYYYRFENGFENDLQRLHLLRDTWEAMIDVLHALAVGEIRFRRINLTAPLEFTDLFSDSVSKRLLNIERTVATASSSGINLSASKVVPVSVLEKMRELNRSRNAFSHSAAQSEAQARTWISECHEDVLGILDDIRALEDCRLLRYIDQIDGSTLRCEILRGHGFTRTIQPIHLTPDQVRDSLRYFQQGQILALHDGCLFSMLPLIFFREDAAGHMTKPCVFRKTRGDSPNRLIEFAVVGESVPLEVNRVSFKTEMDELRALFGLGAD